VLSLAGRGLRQIRRAMLIGLPPLARRARDGRCQSPGLFTACPPVRPAPEGGVVLTLALADVKEAEITGAAPKAASLHDLRCAVDATGRWSCGITIDVQQPAHRPGPTRGWPWRGR